MRFWQRRRREPDEQDIFLRDKGMVQLCQGLGMPTVLITPYTTLACVPSCFLEVYTDAQVQGHHTPFDDAVLITWFGARHYADGCFTQRLAEVRDGKRHLDGVDINDLQATFGAIFAHHLVTGGGPFPRMNTMEAFPPLTRVEGNEIVFGGHFGQGEYRERLSRPIKFALDLDPGLRAIQLIDHHVALTIRNPAALFQYTSINRHPFIGHMIVNYLKLKGRQLTGSDELANTLAAREVVLSIEGDLVATTQKLIVGHEQQGRPPEFLDLALYLSYHSPMLDIIQAERLMRNIYHLLAPGGAFLLGFPLVEDMPGKVSFADLERLALLAGFSAGQAHVGTSNVAHPRLPLYLFFVKA